jgi:asparagine synthase (glutamine-hydrolysing)
MCGICGVYHFKGEQPADPVTVRAMMQSIAHRGPDDEGLHVSGPLGLGFRRLSIIDLAGGHQPMSNAAQSVWVVFNGEIYNFRELREELQAAGHVFRTRSDTEVIVHGYTQWGCDVLRRLNGMFGLAIWDARHRRLVLARDAAGIKLVYYKVTNDTVVFGSELRAVLAALPQPPAVDPAAINLFLRYRYTPSPLTLYQGVRKLAPGTMAVFENDHWRVQRWDHPPAHDEPLPQSDAEATAQLLDIYQRALKRHLLSDVPVGLLLSGGIDSGLLLALMTLYGSHWPTYTVGYGSALYTDDELADASDTAQLYDARHAEVELDRDAFARTLPKIVSIVEEPIAASSIVPMYHVCERARQDVKVALIGQGPDELFAGYTRHLGVQYGEQWRSLPRWLRRCAAAGIARLPRHEALKRGVQALDVEPRLQRHQQVFSLLPAAAVDGLFRDGVLPDGAGARILASWRELEPEMQGMDELGAFQHLELRSSLPDELLLYADKISMAHGLEVRVPYLDREVVAYAERLPARFKIRYGQRKWLHRKVCREFLPTDILARKKRGFAVDAVDPWLRSEASPFAGHLLDRGSLLFEFLQPEAVSRLLSQHRLGRSDNHKILFSLVVLEEWLRARRSAAAHAPPSAGWGEQIVFGTSPSP